MGNFTRILFTTLPLFAVAFLSQSCNDETDRFQNNVQFRLTPDPTYSHGVVEFDSPEGVHARISVSNSNGATILSEHEVKVYKSGESYVTGLLELPAGTYTVTDFIIVQDSVDLYVSPKKGAELTGSEMDALPYQFSITDDHVSTVTMRVVDVRDEDPRKFGYTSKKRKTNSLSIAVYENSGGRQTITGATAELRQNKKLLKVYSLEPRVNTIAIEGDPKLPYTMTIYTAASAKTQTFNLRQLNTNAKKPFQVMLEPAMILKIESHVEEGNEYEEYFDLAMEGSGMVNVNWGDGEQTSATMPFEISHEYIQGSYTAIITGDIGQITDFWGFSYLSNIHAITGLTNLTSLKVYNPSWGVVPLKVDLSKCNQLEVINIAKYGGPYEPVDLRTDFKLPAQHYIRTFMMDATSIDLNRDYINAEELNAMVDNIYNNAVARNIRDGRLFVNQVSEPEAGTLQKMDFLKDNLNWRVGLNDEIYDAYSIGSGRSSIATGSNARREAWLRERFSNADEIIERAHVMAVYN